MLAGMLIGVITAVVLMSTNRDPVFGLMLASWLCVSIS